MKQTTTRRFGMLLMPLLLTLAFSQVLHAQTAYKLGPKPTMDLYGTSTLHNWEMSAHSFAGSAQITLTSDNQLSSINGLTVMLPVHNLKSEHDGMNDNAYEALKADTYRDIVFKLTSSKIVSSGGNKYQITAYGNLTIAGVSKQITLTATGQVNADGSIGVSGTVPLKLSEFNIERPSFMLGTMSVGDALTLNYSLVLVK